MEARDSCLLWDGKGIVPPLGLAVLLPAFPQNSDRGSRKEANFRAPEPFKPNQLALDSKQCWLCQEIATAPQELVEKPALPS